MVITDLLRIRGELRRWVQYKITALVLNLESIIIYRSIILPDMSYCIEWSKINLWYMPVPIEKKSSDKRHYAIEIWFGDGFCTNPVKHFVFR